MSPIEAKGYLLIHGIDLSRVGPIFMKKLLNDSVINCLSSMAVPYLAFDVYDFLNNGP